MFGEHLFAVLFINNRVVIVCMPKDQKERETITVEQLALSNVYQLEAMINLPERKGTDQYIFLMCL